MGGRRSSRWLHFGLGKAGTVESLAVRWPDGAEQTFSGIEPNRFYEINQGEGVPGGALAEFDRATAVEPRDALASRYPYAPSATELS